MGVVSVYHACTSLAVSSLIAFTVYTLTPGSIYGGPSGIDIFNLCKCNTIVYSLMSACEACQEDPWETWSDYSDSCSKILPVAT